MTRTFLVAVNFDDGVPPDPERDSIEIEDALEASGIDVESVKLWAGTAPAQPFAAPTSPIIPPQNL